MTPRGHVAALLALLLAAPAAARVVPTATPTATPVLARITAAGPRARPMRTRRAGAPRVARDAQLTAAGAGAVPVLDPIPSPVVVGEPLTLTGTGFTAGTVITPFVASAVGALAYGPYAPTSWTPTQLEWTVDGAMQLGDGFVTLRVVATDQGFAESNLQSQLLFGSAALNLPTITAVNGVALNPADPSIPTANVSTVLPQNTLVTLTGTGFNDPRVNIFTAAGNVGPAAPSGGWTPTQFQFLLPAGAPTGPGSLQVVNAPYTGNVLSNAVSVPIGVAISITSVSQAGRTVTVNGTGFSSLTVVNLFNVHGASVANLGGLYPTNGAPRIPLTLFNSTRFTFQAPARAITGAAFVQAINPPYIPFSSTGSDADGAFAIVGPTAAPGGFSLRFNGTGSDDLDRVKIPLGNPARPVDVGGNFTLELWMKTAAGNDSGACVAGGDGWINGNIIVDRDVFGDGDDGDYGLSLFGTGGRLAFGVARGSSGQTICGTANVADGAWHHVAVTRSSSSGALRIFVDGQLDASGTGPTGDVGYRNGRATSFPNSDPFLVIGAEKHDAGAAFPSYHGWIDELRLSRTVRYSGAFTPPSAPFTTDPNSAALFHFDEGNGNTVFDAALASGGPSHGVRRVDDPPNWPQWSTDIPFTSGPPTIALTQLTAALSAPTFITHCGDDRLFITEVGGTIRIWNGTQVLATPFLTISPLSSGGERGLLSMAFHPQYAQNGFFYVYYTASSGALTIARYRVSGNPNIADPNSGVTLLSIPHPVSNHNGGQLQFGPDGYLYAGIGDGGGGCDDTGSGCNAQRDDMLLGKLLRLDVNQSVDAPPYHGVPPTNPFVGPGDPLDLIWAKGLRNPWRFSFDRLTGSLLIGDVGQGSREEVDYRPADSPGGENYGWKRMEGFACDTCNLSNCPVAPPPCNDPSLTLPVVDYTHSVGCSITGGYVYRGTQIPLLYGTYLYGDLCSGRLWWARDTGAAWSATQFTPTAGSLYSFGEDVHGELYLARGNGTLTRIGPGN